MRPWVKNGYLNRIPHFFGKWQKVCKHLLTISILNIFVDSWKRKFFDCFMDKWCCPSCIVVHMDTALYAHSCHWMQLSGWRVGELGWQETSNKIDWGLIPPYWFSIWTVFHLNKHTSTSKNHSTSNGSIGLVRYMLGIDVSCEKSPLERPARHFDQAARTTLNSQKPKLFNSKFQD